MSAAPASELKLRVISALVLVALAVASTLLGGIVFQAFWALTAFICFYEWISVSIPGSRPIQYIIAAISILAMSTQPVILSLGWMAIVAGCLLVSAWSSPSPGRFWAPLGLVYAGALAFSITALRASPSYGIIVVFWLFAIVWGSDIAAYFAGRAIGGPKLMPSISPKKTWSGFIGGVTGGMLVSLLVLWFSGIQLHWQHIALASILGVASAAGDLLESAFKRHFNVKDSGQSIPGHGGVLDRVDGFVIAAIFAVLIGLARQSNPAAGLLSW